MDKAEDIEHTPPKSYEINLSISEATRRGQRKALADAWLKEEENSRYRYNVEKGKDGKRIFLRRPAYLNKGFDFQINLESFKSEKGKGTAPKHEDLICDLKAKKKENPVKFAKFRKAIDDVYCCAEPQDALRDHGSPTFKKGLPADTLLKLLKWHFMEQDLTYWNFSGRRKFLKEINEQVDG